MQPNAFVEICRRERDALLATYADPRTKSAVAQKLEAAQLTDKQRAAVSAALGEALTDAFFTLLLALDGAASLGGVQQSYRLSDEAGGVIASGDGRLETVAYDVFR